MKSQKILLLCTLTLLFSACKNNQNIQKKTYNSKQQELQEILDTQILDVKQRYSIINQIANSYLENKD